MASIPEQNTRHVYRMQHIVLQWDYFKLTNKKTAKRKLRAVPEKFESMEVCANVTICEIV